MSGPGRKHAACSDDNPPPKKWGVSAKTIEKWIAKNNKALSTSTWLKYDKADCEYVATLKCSCASSCKTSYTVCTTIAMRLFIGGSKNLRASSFKDHAASDMHARAMLLLKKQTSSDVTEYAPIAKGLHTLDSDAEGKLKHKFEELIFYIASIGATISLQTEKFDSCQRTYQNLPLLVRNVIYKAGTCLL